MSIALSESSSTNVSLINRVQLDDSKAWREMVDLYGPLVAHWCRKSGIPDSVITDVVQDVFLAVLRSLPKYRPGIEGNGFRGWLWGITRHKCIDAHRSEGKQARAAGGSTALLQLGQLAAPMETDEPTESIELNRLLRRAMQQVECEFEDKTWQAFCRTVVDGRDTSIVAAELGLSPASVRKYRSRILRRIRKQLGDEPADLTGTEP